jgi:hypothetical protein
MAVPSLRAVIIKRSPVGNNWGSNVNDDQRVVGAVPAAYHCTIISELGAKIL